MAYERHKLRSTLFLLVLIMTLGRRCTWNQPSILINLDVDRADIINHRKRSEWQTAVKRGSAMSNECVISVPFLRRPGPVHNCGCSTQTYFAAQQVSIHSCHQSFVPSEKTYHPRLYSPLYTLSGHHHFLRHFEKTLAFQACRIFW